MREVRPTVVAIHQPNFFPWLGYFDKIVRSDHFVLLDDAQFPKKGGVWTNRVRLLVNGEARWVTAPVDRSYHGYRAIREVVFDESQPWRETLLRTLETNYSRAPHFGEAFELLLPLIRNPERSIASYNWAALRALLEALGLRADHIRWASDMHSSATGTARLIAVTQTLGGTTYMCGGGAEGYQDDQEFVRCGVELLYQNYAHPVYPQQGTDAFVPGLSIIDALANVGVEGTHALLAGR